MSIKRFQCRIKFSISQKFQTGLINCWHTQYTHAWWVGNSLNMDQCFENPFPFFPDLFFDWQIHNWVRHKLNSSCLYRTGSYFTFDKINVINQIENAPWKFLCWHIIKSVVSRGIEQWAPCSPETKLSHPRDLKVLELLFNAFKIQLKLVVLAGK